MGNMQPLIDAVNFVKNNPDRHNQQQFTAFKNDDSQCILGHAYRIMGYNARWTEYDSDLTTVGTNSVSGKRIIEELGITPDEFKNLFGTFNEDNAIEYAETLIANYAPVKYPVGTKLEGAHGYRYTVEEIIDHDQLKIRSAQTGVLYSWTVSKMNGWTIVEGEVTTEFEYIVRLDEGTKHAGRFVFDSESDARAFAKKLHDGTQSSFTVKLIKQQLAPSAIELSF